jgi:hypothetical protein
MGCQLPNSVVMVGGLLGASTSLLSQLTISTTILGCFSLYGHPFLPPSNKPTSVLQMYKCWSTLKGGNSLVCVFLVRLIEWTCRTTSTALLGVRTDEAASGMSHATSRTRTRTRTLTRNTHTHTHTQHAHTTPDLLPFYPLSPPPLPPSKLQPRPHSSPLDETHTHTHLFRQHRSCCVKCRNQTSHRWGRALSLTE